MTTEVPPGQGNPGRMDLYVSITPASSSKRIHHPERATSSQDNIAQLDGYLESLLKAGAGVRNGILTDGIHYLLRRVGEEKLPLQRHGAEMRTYQPARSRHTTPEGVPARDHLSSRPKNISAHSGKLGDGSSAATPTHSSPRNLLLKEAYDSAPKRSHGRSEKATLAGPAAGSPGQGRRHRRGRKRLAVHQTHLHHQSQSPSSCNSNSWATWPTTPQKDQKLCSKDTSWPNSPTSMAVVDADLFTWPTEVDESSVSLREIARVVEQIRLDPERDRGGDPRSIRT